MRLGRLPLPFRPGKWAPERRDVVDRQLVLELAEEAAVTLRAELQERLVALMAEAIVAVLEQGGGVDDEQSASDSEPQD